MISRDFKKLKKKILKKSFSGLGIGAKARIAEKTVKRGLKARKYSPKGKKNLGTKVGASVGGAAELIRQQSIRLNRKYNR
jgi:hypothetical protein